MKLGENKWEKKRVTFYSFGEGRLSPINFLDNSDFIE